MNAQVKPQIEINVRMSIDAAQVVLEGLSKLPIERAGGLYSGLRETIDKAIAGEISKQAANDSQPSDTPPEPTESPGQTCHYSV